MPIRVARKRPDSYQHGDLRAALVQAGLKLLTEGGVPALSLRAAAQLAGVSHAAPYRHFRDKEALMAAIAEEGFRMLTARMRQEMESVGPDPVTRLRASAWGYVGFARAHPGYFRTMFGEAISEECARQTPSLMSAGREAYGVLRDQIADGVQRGWLRQGDVDELSLAAWSMVHGLSMLAIDRQLTSTLTSDAAAHAVTDRLIRLLETGIRGQG